MVCTKSALLASLTICSTFITNSIAQTRPAVSRSTRGAPVCQIAPDTSGQRSLLNCSADGDLYERPSVDPNTPVSEGKFCIISTNPSSRAGCLNQSATAWASVENRGCIIREIPFRANQLPGQLIAGIINRANVPAILARMNIENREPNTTASICSVKFPRRTRLTSAHILTAQERVQEDYELSRLRPGGSRITQCEYERDPALPGAANLTVAYVDTCQRPMCIANVRCLDTRYNVRFNMPASCLANTDGSCPPAARCIRDTRTSAGFGRESDHTTPDGAATPVRAHSAATTDEPTPTPLPPRDF